MSLFRGAANRCLQAAALYAPGARTLRVRLHRWRGVRIGPGTFISAGALIETEFPELVSIGGNVTVGIRAVIIAHFRDRGLPAEPTVVIEDDAFIGPGAILLPRIRIGKGAVVSAGTVVSRSVEAGTMVQGNPARVVARCEVPLGVDTHYSDFLRGLKPIRGSADS